jgi:hypothetical protein
MKSKLILLVFVTLFVSAYSQQKKAGVVKHHPQPAVTSLPPATNLKWVKDPQTQLYGLIDSVTHKVIISPKYEDARPFINNTCLVQSEILFQWQLINAKGTPLLNTPVDYVMSEHHNLIVVLKDNLYGIINRIGKVIVPIKYKLITKADDDDFFFLKDQNSNTFWYHESGAIFKNTLKRTSDLYLVSDDKDHYGLFSIKQQKLILPLKYGPFLKFTAGRTVITENNKAGLLSDSGHIVIPCVYDKLLIDKSNLIWVMKDSLQGYFDKYGNNVLPVIYNEIYSFGWNLAKIKLNGKLGLINKKGKIVLPVEYNAIGSTNEHFTFFVKGGHWVGNAYYEGGLWGVINSWGDIIVPPRYSYIYSFSEDMALVVQGGVYNPATTYFDGAKYGYINSSGKEIISAMFDSATNFKNGTATVSLGTRTYKIDKTGNEVYQSGFSIRSSH